MPNELIVADVQQAFLEYRVNFKEPIVEIWYGGRQGETVKALLKALLPWHVGLENLTWNHSARNGSEIQLTFAVPSLLASIQVGLGGAIMTAFNPDWSRAPQFVSLFQTGLDALKTIAAQDLLSQQTTLGLHVKPSERPFREVLMRFVNTKALGSEDAIMFGVSVYHNDYSFVIDSSALFPGSVFIKLIRNFVANERFETMAKILLEDEENTLHRLGLRVQ